MKLIQHNYGKAKVRVLKVFRAAKIHSIKELDVQAMLQGDFDACLKAQWPVCSGLARQWSISASSRF